MKNSVAGGGIAAATGTTGLAQMMNWIPDDIGKLAVLVSILASFVVIVSTIYRIRLSDAKTETQKAVREKAEKEKMKIEIEIENMRADSK